MNTFSIAELEQFSSIKAHTIRVWEKRFGIFKAQRTETNMRYYNLDDLALLLDFSLLNQFGHRVSVLAPLDRHSFRQMIHALKIEAARKQHQVNQLIVCMHSLNIEDFELILDSAVQAWGIEHTIEDVILPFLERLELFSYEGYAAGEYHFVITAVRKKIILAVEQAMPKEPITKSVLLYLPQGEHYDLLLLYLNYRLKKAGFNVLYLGTNVPAPHLQEVIKQKQPHFVIGYVSPNDKKAMHRLSMSFQEDKGTTFYFIATGKLPLDYTLPLWKVKFVAYKEVPDEVLRLALLLKVNEKIMKVERDSAGKAS